MGKEEEATSLGHSGERVPQRLLAEQQSPQRLFRQRFQGQMIGRTGQAPPWGLTQI